MDKYLKDYEEKFGEHLLLSFTKKPVPDICLIPVLQFNANYINLMISLR